MFITAGHLYELSKETSGSNKSAAILNEIQNLANHVLTAAYCEAVKDPDPPSKQGPVVVIAAMCVIEGFEASLCATV